MIIQTAQARSRQKLMDLWMNSFRMKVGGHVPEEVRMKIRVLCNTYNIPHFIGLTIGHELNLSYNVTARTRTGSF